jgi:AcrR family transcriptional regulator
MAAADGLNAPKTIPKAKPSEVPAPAVSPKDTHDPRAERTRNAIFSAIQDVTAERSATVSVADIVRAAGISRSSFYAHFASLDELAAELMRMQFADLASPGAQVGSEEAIPSQHAVRVGFSRLVAHMVENLPLYSSVLELPLTRSAYDNIVAAYVTRLMESVLVMDDVPRGLNQDIALTYIAGGTLTLISAWMRGLLDVSDDQLVDQLVMLLPSWLSD